MRKNQVLGIQKQLRKPRIFFKMQSSLKHNLDRARVPRSCHLACRISRETVEQENPKTLKTAEKRTGGSFEAWVHAVVANVRHHRSSHHPQRTEHDAEPRNEQVLLDGGVRRQPWGWAEPLRQGV